jgi:hypothetical protein
LVPVNLLRRHLATAFGAGAARLDAIVHVSEPLAFAAAVLTDIGTFGAKMLMMGRADDQDMCAGAADFRTCEHELDMRWPGVFSAEFETMGCAHAKADLVAAQTSVDAGLHFRVGMVHGETPSGAH